MADSLVLFLKAILWRSPLWSFVFASRSSSASYLPLAALCYWISSSRSTFTVCSSIRSSCILSLCSFSFSWKLFSLSYDSCNFCLIVDIYEEVSLRSFSRLAFFSVAPANSSFFSSSSVSFY